MEPSLDDLRAALVDASSEDPRILLAGDRSGPKACVEGELAAEWVTRLAPGCSPALVLAALAHHLDRWSVPRQDFPAGRAGYLRWRRHLYEVQGEAARRTLLQAGAGGELAERVAALVAKRGLARDPANRDPEAQTLEDAVCLVFLQTQLADFAESRPDDDVVEIIAKTWAKMSDGGRAAALQLDLPAPVAVLVGRALAG